jgi:hypothetical protein
VVELEAGEEGGRLVRWRFHELPTRPMHGLSIDVTGFDAGQLERRVRAELGTLPDEAVVHLRFEGELAPDTGAALRASTLRELHPPTMTVNLIFRPKRL